MMVMFIGVPMGDHRSSRVIILEEAKGKSDMYKEV